MPPLEFGSKVARPETRDRQWLLFGSTFETLERVVRRLETDPFTAVTVCDSRETLTALAMKLSPGVVTLVVSTKQEIIETLSWLKTHLSRFRALGVRVIILSPVTDPRVQQGFLTFGAAEVLSTSVPEATLLHKMQILTKTLGARRRSKLSALEALEQKVFKSPETRASIDPPDFRIETLPIVERATKILNDVKQARELRRNTRDEAREAFLYAQSFDGPKISRVAMLIHMSDQLSRGEAAGPARQWLVDFMRKELKASAVEWVDFRMNPLNVSPKQIRTGAGETLKFEIPDASKKRSGLAYGWIRVWRPGGESLNSEQQKSIEQVVQELAVFAELSG